MIRYFVISAVISALSFAASLEARKPEGTYGNGYLPWTTIDSPKTRDLLELSVDEPVHVMDLVPQRSFELEKELKVRRRGGPIIAGTAFAQAKGESLTLCEVERRKGLNHVECFVDVDQDGVFDEYYPVSLSVSHHFYVSRQYHLIGSYYFDSKKPLDQSISVSDFKFKEPTISIRRYLNVAKIDRRKERVEIEVCAVVKAQREDADNRVITRACNSKSKVSVKTIPAYFSTALGSGKIMSVSEHSIVVDFTPKIDDMVL